MPEKSRAGEDAPSFANALPRRAPGDPTDDVADPFLAGDPRRLLGEDAVTEMMGAPFPPFPPSLYWYWFQTGGCPPEMVTPMSRTG